MAIRYTSISGLNLASRHFILQKSLTNNNNSNVNYMKLFNTNGLKFITSYNKPLNTHLTKSTMIYFNKQSENTTITNTKDVNHDILINTNDNQVSSAVGYNNVTNTEGLNLNSSSLHQNNSFEPVVSSVEEVSTDGHYKI